MRCSRTKAPSLCRRYPASSVLRASPPPCRPDLTLAGCRLARATPPDRASRVASIPLFHACCRHYPGGTSRCLRRSLPDRWQPSPFSRRVGFRIARFGACSTFAHAAARMVAKPPVAARCVGVLQTMSLPPSSAPTATGWSDSCRAGFAPAEKWRLFTAHAKNHSKRRRPSSHSLLTLPSSPRKSLHCRVLLRYTAQDADSGANLSDNSENIFLREQELETCFSD